MEESEPRMLQRHLQGHTVAQQLRAELQPGTTFQTIYTLVGLVLILAWLLPSCAILGNSLDLRKMG